MKVYEFIYCSDSWESGPVTISIHKTREGAERAMNAHMEYERKEYEENTSKEFKSKYPFDLDKYWNVKEVELKD